MVVLKTLISLFLLMWMPCVQAQGQDLPKNLEKLYSGAKEAYYSGEYDKAEKDLLKLISKAPDFVEAYLLVGDIYFETGDMDQGIAFYEKAILVNPEYSATVYIILANAEFEVRRYESAVEHYKDYLVFKDIGDDVRRAVRKKMDLSVFRRDAILNPVPFDPVNAGENINSVADEYINTLTADGSTMYFTVKEMQRDPQKATFKKFAENFYFSSFSEHGWDARKKLGSPVDAEGDAGALSTSPDGRTLYFTACFRNDSHGSCDLYFAEKNGNSWSVPENMGRIINSDLWDSQPSISPDGKILYFVSNRKGGSGSSDIWMSELLPDGGWGPPENLGKTINTDKTEMAPFIHHDNKTLYFASDGRTGMGGMDLFMTQRSEDGSWLEPLNLGYPVNTINDELAVVVSASGETGFISAERPEGFGKYDIYSFELPAESRPAPVTYLKGLVFDEETYEKLGAGFELIDLETGEIIMESVSDPLTGEFLICIPVNANYALNVSREGYLFYSGHFTLDEAHTVGDPFLKNIPLQPVKEGNTIVLNNIFFDTDKFDLKEASLVELGKLLEFLRSNPSICVEIGGHTDNTGTAAHNDELSQNRAGSVYDYLLEHGIPSKKLTYKGYGASLPIATNDTEEGRAQNRRTELKILNCKL